MTPFKDTDYGKSIDPNLLIWVEDLMAGTNPMDRIDIANEKTGTKVKDLSDEHLREVIYRYLVWRNNNKAQLLVSKQVMFYNCNKLALVDFKAKDAEDMAKLNKLASDLSDQIEVLVGQVFGEMKELGVEQMKVALTPEMRLKNKPKV